MNEQDWLAAQTAAAMSDYLERLGPGKVTERKLRLFACACCRRIWGLLPEQSHRHAVEVAERFADGLADLTELEEARSVVWQHIQHAAVLGRSAAPASWAVYRTAGVIRAAGSLMDIAWDADGNPKARATDRAAQA